MTKPMLGDRVKDRISGFSGIVVATTQWLTGCDRMVVQPEEVNKETGKPVENSVFDETQLDILEVGAYVNKMKPETRAVVAGAPPGGPRDDAAASSR